MSSGGSAQPKTIDVAESSVTELHGIDDANDVFGSYFDQTGQHAFARLADGTDVTLGTSLPDTAQSSAILAASGSGEVVGTYFDKGANHLFEAKLDAGVFTKFQTVVIKNNETDESIAYDQLNPRGVNDSGYIVGDYSSDGTSYGFVEHDGKTTTLQPPDISRRTSATGINALNEVVGYYFGIDNSSVHGFTYTDGVFKTLNVGKNTKILGVNDSGQVTGTYDNGDGTVGFVLSGSDLTTIDDDNPELVTINNQGLVGGSITSGQQYAAVFGPDTPAGGAAYSISASNDVLEGTPPDDGNDITFTITRTDASAAGSVQVDLTGTARKTATATEDVDYTVSGLDQDTISFAVGDASKTFTVRSVPDTDVESDESVIATLSNASGTGTIAQAQAQALILNDDVAPGGAGNGNDGGTSPSSGGTSPSGGGTSSGGTTPSGSPITPAPVTNPPASNTPTNNTPGAAAVPVIAYDPTVSVSGDTVTMSGTVSDATGVASVELLEIVNKAGRKLRPIDLGAADLQLDAAGTIGTWSLPVTFEKKGYQTNLEAVATGGDTQTATALSQYSLTTRGPAAEPFTVVQDHYPQAYDFTGQTYFAANGHVYYNNTYQALDDGVSYTYSGGDTKDGFFVGKDYATFTDIYMNDADANMIPDIAIHVENNTAPVIYRHIDPDASFLHRIDVEGSGLSVNAIGNDLLVNSSVENTTFIFGAGFGHDEITAFQAGDTIELHKPKISAARQTARLAEALGSAQDIGGNAVLTFGHDTITLDNVAVADLKQKHNMLFHL